MGAPTVKILEYDLSTRVPAYPGIYAGIVIAAKKGALDKATLPGNENTFLKMYTPDEGLKVGYSLSYYSALAFLAVSGNLYVVRAAGAGVLYGGVKIESATSVTDHAALSTGESDPEAHTFGTNQVLLIHGTDPGAWNNEIGIRIWVSRVVETINGASAVDAETDQITVASNKWETGEPVSLRVDDAATMPTGLISGNTYYTIRVSDTAIKLADSEADAVAGTAADITAVGSGNFSIIPMKNVAEPNSFLLEVYKSSNTVTPVEAFYCCRVQGQKDGFGRNMYVETVLEQSYYVNAQDNLLVTDSVLPKAQPTLLSLAAGADGSAVTDGVMMTAANIFRNADDLPITLLLDGGYSTTAYQRHLISIAEDRMDCVAILSVPYSYEASADYLNEILNYRNNVLNVSTSYGAMFSPAVKIHCRFTDRTLYASCEGYDAARLAWTAANYDMWWPAGGLRRGQLTDVLDLRRRFSKPDMDSLYDNGINPNRFYPGKGILLWGNKTLLGRPSEIEYLNVRMLLISLETTIAEALEDYLFEFNDDATRAMVKAMVDTAMETYVARRGIYGYETKCDLDNNLESDIENRRLILWLFVKPMADVEEIKFATIITRYGMSFSLAAQAMGAA